MKVRYYIDDGYVNMQSDFMDAGIDLLELLASDISSKESIERFNQCIFQDYNIWCSNLSEVKIIEKKVVISSAFSLDNGIVPSRSMHAMTLKKIICDWKEFIENKQERKNEY